MNKAVEAGVGACIAPPATEEDARVEAPPKKTYRAMAEVKGRVGDRQVVYPRGAPIPNVIAESIPNLGTLLGTGAVKVVYE